MGVFDIVGPVMIGPSSSHTAGAARLGKMARAILGEEPVAATVILYGSFAKTYRGHGTDKAVAGGLLGLDADDPLIKEALALASQAGLKVSFVTSDRDAAHPNTVEFHLAGRTGKAAKVTGMSIGGGQIVISRIDGFDVEVSGDYYTLITIHRDKPGVIAAVTKILAQENVNVAQMKVSRQLRDADALMVMETDQAIPVSAISEISAIPAIQSAITVQPLQGGI